MHAGTHPRLRDRQREVICASLLGEMNRGEVLVLQFVLMHTGRTTVRRVKQITLCMNSIVEMNHAADEPYLDGLVPQRKHCRDPRIV